MKKIIFLLFVLSTSIYSQNPCPGTPTVTYAGKTYNTVQIGTQCWLKENLNIGTMIQGNQEQTDNGTIEKYCYSNSPPLCETYGGLYQWNEAMAYRSMQGSKGICPDFWHIPTEAEFLILKTAVHYDSKTLIAANSNATGFSVLLAGYRYYSGFFLQLGYDSNFWSSTENYSFSAFKLNLKDNLSLFNLTDEYKVFGLSVRCLYDYTVTANQVDNKKELPLEYSLSQNYPNPFNPSSLISFAIPKSSNVSLKVYDLLGKEITTLVDKELSAGYHEVSFDGSSLSSGIYLYTIQAADFIQTKKMILLK
jgi:uncharacterized protein (TIGR02145 family)